MGRAVSGSGRQPQCIVGTSNYPNNKEFTALKALFSHWLVHNNNKILQVFHHFVFWMLLSTGCERLQFGECTSYREKKKLLCPCSFLSSFFPFILALQTRTPPPPPTRISQRCRHRGLHLTLRGTAQITLLLSGSPPHLTPRTARRTRRLGHAEGRSL